MSRAVIHILAKSCHRYLHYATILVDSLIRNGGVRGTDIFVSVDTALLSSDPLTPGDMLSNGCVEYLGGVANLEFYPASEIGKFRRCDSIFERFEDVGAVIQMDADMALTESLDFIRQILRASGEHLSGFTLANYRQPKQKNGSTFGALFRSRSIELGVHPFKPMDHDKNAQRRFDLLVGAALEVDPVFVAMQADSLGWGYGAVHAISRKLWSDGSFWRAFLLLNTFNACDESIVAMWRSSTKRGAGDGFHFIDESILPMRTSPMTGFGLDVGDGPGLVHYSGDWFRANLESSRAIIQEKLHRVIYQVAQ